MLNLISVVLQICFSVFITWQCFFQMWYKDWEHVLSPAYTCLQDTLREDCNSADDCLTNCCVNPVIAPVYFVIFVLMAQFVLVNVVVAVLMKHLEVSWLTRGTARDTHVTPYTHCNPRTQYCNITHGHFPTDTQLYCFDQNTGLWEPFKGLWTWPKLRPFKYKLLSKNKCMEV